MTMNTDSPTLALFSQATPERDFVPVCRVKLARERSIESPFQFKT